MACRAIRGDSFSRYSAVALGALFTGILPTNVAAGKPRLIEDRDGTLRLVDSESSRGTSGTVIKAVTPRAQRGPASVRQQAIGERTVVLVTIPIVKGGETPARRINENVDAELWIGEHHGGGIRRLLSEVTGSLDTDGETANAIAVEAAGITRYQTSVHVSRCDGVPARLFTERWDFARRRFVPVADALGAAPPPLPLSSQGPAPATARPQTGFRFVAGSDTPGANRDARRLSAPVELSDGNPATFWSSAPGGAPAGAFFTARAPRAGYRVSAIRFWLPRDPTAAAARPARIRVLLGARPDQQFSVDFSALPWPEGARWLVLPQPVASSCLTVVAESAGSGTAVLTMGDMDVFTDLDGAAGDTRLADDLARGEDCPQRLSLLAERDHEVLIPALVDRFAAAAPTGKLCLLHALLRTITASNRAAATIAERVLPDALRTVDPDAQPELAAAIITVTARVGEPAVAPLRAALGAAMPEPSRALAARALVSLDHPEAQQALLSSLRAAGSGSPNVARGALASCKPPVAGLVLTALQKSDLSPRATADLLFVLARTIRKEPPLHAAARSRALALLASPNGDFAVRARGVEVLGALGDAASIEALAGIVSRDDNAVIRHLAVLALGAATSSGDQARVPPPPRVETVLRTALADRDPRVREGAARLLGRGASVAGAVQLLRAVEGERWPFVRRGGVEALSKLCPTGVHAFLGRAVTRDTGDVRRAALRGLFACQHPRARAAATAALSRKREAAAVRETAAHLLAESGPASDGANVALAVDGLLSESQADLALEPSAAAALMALATIDRARALAPALKFMASKRAALERAGVEALGLVCDPAQGRAALQRAAEGADPFLAGSARAALARCASPSSPTSIAPAPL